MVVEIFFSSSKGKGGIKSFVTNESGLPALAPCFLGGGPCNKVCTGACDQPSAPSSNGGSMNAWSDGNTLLAYQEQVLQVETATARHLSAHLSLV